MNVGIIGAGHVGLPTAGALARIGHRVVATDADRDKINLLLDGGMPFFEPGLEELVREEVASRRLRFSPEPGEAVEGAEVVFICVGTPPRASGEANLLALEHSAEVVARHAAGPTAVAEKSTVPAGTAERVAEVLRRHRPDGRFHLVCNPEFLREGSAVEDSLRPGRILVGSDTSEGGAVMRELYGSMIERGSRLIETDLRTAELAKHACNAFLALKVSFANALARLSEAAGADIVAVTEVMGADPRIGPGHLGAGLGYGGSCFPKDLRAFQRLAERLGYDFPLLREIEHINDQAVEAAFRKVEDAVWNLEGKRVAILGLAFKPGTDDVRYSPALAMAGRLLGAGARVVAWDPQAGPNAQTEVPDIELAAGPYDALDGSHCAVIATEWDELRELDLDKVRETMAVPLVVDGRNVFDPPTMVAAGFTYFPTGRPPVRP